MAEPRKVKFENRFDFNKVYEGKNKDKIKKWGLFFPVIKLKADFMTDKFSCTEQTIMKEFEKAMMAESKKITMIVDTFLSKTDITIDGARKEVVPRLNELADGIEKYFKGLCEEDKIKPEGQVDFDGADSLEKSFDALIDAGVSFQGIVGTLRADVDDAYAKFDGAKDDGKGKFVLDKEALAPELVRLLNDASTELGKVTTAIAKANRVKGPGSGNAAKAKASKDPQQAKKGKTLDDLQSALDDFNDEMKTVTKRIEAIQAMATKLKSEKPEALPDSFKKLSIPDAHIADLKKAGAKIPAMIKDYQKLDAKK